MISIEELSNLIQTTKENLETDSSDKAINIRRSAFIFGLSEIEESIKKLLEGAKKM